MQLAGRVSDSPQRNSRYRCYRGGDRSSSPSFLTRCSANIMLDILILMFFAIIGLMFLSYIIYML